jgi:hypothetical protein
MKLSKFEDTLNEWRNLYIFSFTVPQFYLHQVTPHNAILSTNSHLFTKHVHNINKAGSDDVTQNIN